MNQNQPDWSELSCRYPLGLIREIRNYFESYEPFQVDSGSLQRQIDCELSTIEDLLEEFFNSGCLLRSDQWQCQYCEKDLTKEQAELPECPYCNGEFKEGGTMIRHYYIYSREGQRGRDVKWVLTLHGINTRGSWQEEFSWRLAKLYGYSVPVAIYKYGNIKLSPFIPTLQQFYLKKLIKKIKNLYSETEAEEYGTRPDVIAHSFGSWLIAEALKQEKDLHIGRLILVGSIVRPDFNWSELIDSKQVEAVMCHYSKKDYPARFAHYFIPKSGPSGYLGFNDQTQVIHKQETQFGHSDYFDCQRLGSIMENIWKPFLTCPSNNLSELFNNAETGHIDWIPTRWSYVTRILKIPLFLAAFVLSWAVPLGFIIFLGLGYLGIRLIRRT